MLACLLAGARADAAPPAETQVPWFEAQGGRIELTWVRGARPKLEATATLEKPVFRLVRQQDVTPEPKQPKRPPPGAGEAVRAVSPLPLEVDRLAIHGGTIWFVDVAEPEHVRLRIDELEVTIENFSTSRSGSAGLPTLIAMRGRVGSTGEMSAFVTLDPWTGQLDLAGRAQVVGLQLADIAGLVERPTDLRLVEGTATVFMEFSIHENQITGEVKPFITGAELTVPGGAPIDEIKGWVARGAIELLGRDVRGEERVATEVPIEGKLIQPDVGVVDAILELIGNAFLAGLQAGFAGLAPE